jgi:hypothetical protein
MAQNKNTTLVVGLVSLLLVGTTAYFVIKSIKKRSNEVEPQPPFPPQPTPEKKKAQIIIGDTINAGIGEPIEQKTGLGGFLDSISNIFKQRTTESGKDPFSNFKFPIRRGQKGENVKKLQQLILSINTRALPKFGADGDFGSETASALTKLIGKDSIDNQADLDKLKNVGYQTASKIALNMASGFKLY